MGPLAKLFLTVFGVYSLVVTSFINGDLADKACINSTIRMYLMLLFIFCTILPVVVITIQVICEPDCYNRCATFESKVKKEKSEYYGTSSLITIFIVNLFVLIIMSLLLSEINKDSTCNVSDLTYKLIYSVLGITSAIVAYCVVILGLNYGPGGVKSKEQAAANAKKGLVIP